MEREVAGANVKLSAVALKKTGRSSSIDGYPCEEYRGIGRLDVMDMTVYQCMSQDAPGARELANFQQEVALRLNGRSLADSADSSKKGMPLEQSSSIKPLIPATSSPDKVPSAIMTTKTVVKNLEVRNLPSATFEPPPGFRMETPRQETAFEVQPEE